ncbi:MAG: ATP-binding cassette domain-containing protein [Burkholderiaceae bacterium]|nr:ATP-binding cassette domain-containing protein [Burkholderiaceae bacterium]MBP7659835.1 ATP-binding cassette domain-containing protein [Burkholderiaceae bacterium]
MSTVPAAARGAGRRRWLAHEVVQTSSMDCGPASLKCVLEGFGVPVSYGRLREACQTDVDGTSIDVIEDVANQMGVAAEQVLIPADHLFLPRSSRLPAIVVVRHADGSTHFVVVWRRHGRWLQVMDPALGRRWLSCASFAKDLFAHQQSVSGADWREWAASPEFLDPLRERMSLAGLSKAARDRLIERALADPGWFPIATLDASTRLVQSVVAGGGIRRGLDSMKLLAAVFQQTCENVDDIYAIIPQAYWSAAPDPDSAEYGELRLLLRGAVVLKLSARQAPTDPAHVSEPRSAMSPELAAALSEKPGHPMAQAWSLLKADGLLAPAALLGAMAIASGTTLIETLLFRGLFDLGALLNLPSQRLAAVAGLMAFVALALLIQIPIAAEALRFGRHLETRLRMALLDKLPRLTDRYFQSRPISDMADRSHSLHMIRQVPALGIQCFQSVFELLLALLGIALIDPASLPLAALVVVSAMAMPALLQPVLNERDLRVRNHGGALHTFYLDALLGLVPVRTHRAEQVVSRQHEGLLVEWARAARGLVRVSILGSGFQSLVCLGLVATLLVQHFQRIGGVGGADLLLIFWALKLQDKAAGLTALAHQYPAQRNVLLRLLEPLSALEEDNPHTRPHAAPGAAGGTPNADGAPAPAMRIAIEAGQVVAAGHTILRELNLVIEPGEQIAIVGVSGAGKSTLLGLLLGWHRLAQGRLFVDGEDAGSMGLTALRRQTAWVDPGIQIWNKSFLDNLTYATEGRGLEGIERAIDAANLRGVLESLPQGLQTHLGESGALLSGGEGQRVRLARALMQSDTRLILLDEPFRGLDRGQRSRLLTEARQWWRGRTMLCVTHDVSETQEFDRVLVIEDGVVIEDGAPALLAGGRTRYRELLDAETQVRDQMWQGRQWRRLHLHEGRLHGSVPQLGTLAALTGPGGPAGTSSAARGPVTALRRA